MITRFGIVMDEKGGALGQMIPLFKNLLEVPLASGRQWFSWVHIKDLAEAFVFLMKHPEFFRPGQSLCSQPRRKQGPRQGPWKGASSPSFHAAPRFMIKLVLGEFGSVILGGQRVIPRRLLENGFVFQYPDIDKALQAIVGH